MIPKPPPSGHSAATLTELLVGIGVFSTLALLLLSTVNATLDRSHAATCLSQLRQVAAAGLLFAQDHNGGLPISSFNRQPGGMMTYLNTDIAEIGPTVLTCPALQRQWPTRAYHHRTTSINLVATQGHSKSKKNLRAIATPARTLFFLDGLINPTAPDADQGRTFYHYHFGVLNLPEFEDRFRFPHQQRANAVYLDGHAESLDRQTLLDWSEQSLLWRSQ